METLRQQPACCRAHGLSTAHMPFLSGFLFSTKKAHTGKTFSRKDTLGRNTEILCYLYPWEWDQIFLISFSDLVYTLVLLLPLIPRLHYSSSLRILHPFRLVVLGKHSWIESLFQNKAASLWKIINACSLCSRLADQEQTSVEVNYTLCLSAWGSSHFCWRGCFPSFYLKTRSRWVRTNKQ